MSPKVQYSAVPPMLRKTVAMHSRISKIQDPPATSSANARAEKVEKDGLQSSMDMCEDLETGFYHE